jgi:hypothetical protein
MALLATQMVEICQVSPRVGGIPGSGEISDEEVRISESLKMNTNHPSGRWLQLAGFQVGLVGLLSAQEIRPVWVQHVNLPTNALPILRKADAATERADGGSGFDNYAAFVR